MKRIYFLFSILFFLACTSCERKVDIPFPNDKPKLVIHSFISPDQDSIQVTISQSNPFINQTPGKTDYINNAEVYINDIPLKKAEENGLYFAKNTDIKVQAGKTYQLKANADGFKSISASTTVPTETPTKIEKSTIRDTTGSSKEFDLTLFDEHPNQYQYSAIYGIAEYTRVFQTGEERTSRFSLYFPQQLFEDGNFIENKLALRGIRLNVYQSLLYKDKKIHIKYLNTDEGYYRYHKTIEDSESENPLSEPIINYSNIENGLGIFASYTALSKTFQIP